MTNALARHNPASTAPVRAHATDTDAGIGIDPASISFTERLLSFESLPAAFSPAAATHTRGSTELVLAGGSTAPRLPHGSPLASHAEQQRGVVRRSGQVYQVRRGWAAHNTALVLVEARRALTQRPDGRFAPTGAWALTRREVFGVDRIARQERIVSVGTGAATGTQDAGAPASPRTTTPAEQALAALPEAVRRTVLASVPAPENFMGVLAQWTGAAGTRWEATLLRQDSSHAIAVVATRLATADAWTVRETRYALGAHTCEERND